MRIYTYCFRLASGGGETPVEIRVFASSALAAQRRVRTFLIESAGQKQPSILRHAAVTRMEPEEMAEEQTRFPPISPM